MSSPPLKKTSLNARHRASGAKMVPYGGWDMPLEYSGITAEHMAVRTGAGLFDVSHMGEIEIAGKDALAALQQISCNDASKLQPGQAQYSGLLTPDGHVRGRPGGVQAESRSFPARGERGEPLPGLRVDRRAHRERR